MFYLGVSLDCVQMHYLIWDLRILGFLPPWAPGTNPPIIPQGWLNEKRGGEGLVWTEWPPKFLLDQHPMSILARSIYLAYMTSYKHTWKFLERWKYYHCCCRYRCWDCIGFNSKKRLGLLLFSFVEMIATDPRRIRWHRCATQVHTWILAREASKHHRNGRKMNRKQRMQGTASASTSLPRNRELLFPGVTESSCWQMCFFLFFFFP
jgi:hypothetical protein